LTPGHEEHLGDVVAGYGTGAEVDVIRAWWSLRSLLAVRWLKCVLFRADEVMVLEDPGQQARIDDP
jgi:hypothetical protein